MPYRAAASLMLLRHGAVLAFRAQPNGDGNPLRGLEHGTRSADQCWPLRTAALDSIPSLESILDDGRGHINSDLAGAVYEWELALDGSDVVSDSLREHFSTRDGLRLVDELAREILSSLGGDGEDGAEKSGIPYNDLVQEGMIALLRAMSTYDNYKSHTTTGTLTSFKEYARDSIHSSFLHFLAHSSRPIRLPLSLQTTLRAANAAAEKLRQKLGREPSLVQVAKEVDIAPEQLALYRKLHRSMVSRAGAFVSMEDGMEVYDPTYAGLGMGTGPRSTRDLDAVNDGRATTQTTAGANEQDLIQLNSQEDDWTREAPERSVALLRDALADAEEINNPLSYTHHHLLNEELDAFLKETLTGEELTVIQLRFGLVDSKHGGKGWTSNEIGHRLGLGREDVVRVASGALEKLRKAAPSFSANWKEDDDDAFVEVSL